MNTWTSCKKILCVRPDNMGDLLMSSPAISAVKETFGCSITVLTSSFAKGICRYIPEIDEVLVWDVPWVKGTEQITPEDFSRIINTVRQEAFDAAVIFTVFSQNPLPAALMLTLAGIPKRLAYCRENPYHLLSHWVPEKEPYDFIRHQVRRDLDLVKSVGATTQNENIRLRMPEHTVTEVRKKLTRAGVDPDQDWLIMHPGVSEKKREYPADMWIEAGRKISNELNQQIIVTGALSESRLAESISDGIGAKAYAMAGRLSIEEFITLIAMAPLVISVNTGTAHLAAGLQTKVIVLYALTNPQHTPWKTIGKVLPFSIPENMQSRNEVLQFVYDKYYRHLNLSVEPNEIFQAARELLIIRAQPPIPELIYGIPRESSSGHEYFEFPGAIKFPEQ